jgi:phosphatidate cytidylyltransferase
VLFRFISSAVILPLFVWTMFHEPALFRVLVVVALMLGYEEYRRIMAAKGLQFSPWLGLLALLLILLPPALGENILPDPMAQWLLPRSGSLGLAFFFMAAAIWRVYHADLQQGLMRFVAELGGLVYLGLLGLHIVKLHALYQGPWWCLLVFWYAWIYDSGALFVGKAFGKTPFSPLSPGKTWEGFWGGIAVNAALSALILPHFFPPDFPFTALSFALLSVPASVLAQVGDLFESMVKRFAGVKDSSSLISAHGGFLDKMDSSLFVAPLVYLAATMLTR